MTETNGERLFSLDARGMAAALLRLTSDLCAVCPKLRRQSCRDDCISGLSEWLMQPVNKQSFVWKGTKK